MFSFIFARIEKNYNPPLFLLFLEHMIKEVRHYMEHDGLIDKPVVLKPPDPDDQAQDEVQWP